MCHPLSCFSLGSFAVPPEKRDYLENFHPGSGHHNIGIPANRAGSVAKLIFVAFNDGAEILVKRANLAHVIRPLVL